MTPAARVQAAIDLLDAIIAAARDGGPAADTLIATYFKTRRYAGSKDRRAVRDHVYAAIRRTADCPDTGRAALIGLAREQPDIAGLFDGSPHGPAPIAPDEAGAAPGIVPGWIAPLIAQPVEQEALLGRAPVDLRINRLKTTPDVVAPDFPDAVPISGLPDALRLPEGWPVERSDAWISGRVEVQDAGSQLISKACGAQVDDGQADIVLVDAPCSGTGTWRRNPEARWRLTPARLDRLVSEQARILDFAAPLLAPGGLLVYAVCALTDREGRDQVDAFLTRHPGFTVEAAPVTIGRAHGGGCLLTPAHDGTDGFFFARLRHG
jgi:hypothetical protein